jgi:hypothetical protein
MSFSVTMTWEVRATGSDGNSGGFRGGSNITPPAAPVLSDRGAIAGGFSAGTYFFVLTYSELQGAGVQGDLETPYGAEASITVLSGHGIKVTSPANPFGFGSCSYNVYVSQTSGGPYRPINAGANANGNALSQDCGVDNSFSGVDFSTVGTDYGPPGIDYTQQNGVQATYTDLVIDGSNSKKLTSVAHPGDATLVGNTINVTSGTGFTVQRLEIVYIDGAGAYYVDKSAGTTSSTGGHGVLGGALASPGLASAQLEIGVDSGCVFIKAGTYTLSASNNAAGGRMTCDSDNALFVGYNTTRARNNQDTTRPVLQAGADSITMLGFTHDRCLAANLIFDANGHSNITGFAAFGTASFVRDCLARNGCTTGFQSATGDLYWRCQVDACTGQGFYAASSGTLFFGCEANLTTGYGFLLGGTSKNGSMALHCVSLANNGGTCFQSDTGTQFYVNCTAFDTSGTSGGGNAVGFGTNPAGTHITSQWVSCLAVNFSKNSGFSQGASDPTGHLLAGGGFSNQANVVLSGNGRVPARKIFGFTLPSNDPFNNSAANDFGLNNVMTGGHLLRGAGLPGHTALTTWPFLSSNGFTDVGAVQTSSLVTGMLVHPGYSGGFKG